MASVYDNPSLTSLRNEANTAAQSAGAEQAAGVNLADSLREALTKKFSTSNPLVQNREGALADYMATTESAPLAYTAKSAGGQSDVVYTPQEQASLIAARRSVPTAKLATANTLLNLGVGGIGDIVDSVSRAHEGYVKGKQNEAALKRQQYTDLLTELSQRAEEAYKQQQLAIAASKVSATKTKDNQKKADAMSSILASLSAISDAKNQLKQGGAGLLEAGDLFGLRRKLPESFNILGLNIPNPLSYSKKTTDLQAKLGTANTRLFEAAGKAFTGPEQELLKGLIAKASDNPQSIQSALDQATVELMRKLQYLGTGGELPTSTVDALQSMMQQDDFQPE